MINQKSFSVLAMGASLLQQQFPLSPKKFWKKMWSSFIGGVLIMCGLGFLGIIMVASGTNGPMDALPKLKFFAFSLAVVFVVWMILRVFYVKAYIRTYYYSADDNFITIKKGVFAPTEIHVQFQKIQDVYVDQDIPDRLMGLYDVHIASATVTSGMEAHIDGVEKEAAEGLKIMLLGRISSNGNTNIPSMTSSVLSSTQQSSSTPLSDNISTQTYPITSRWLVLSYVSDVIVGIVMFFVGLAFWAFLSTQGTSATSISDYRAIEAIIAIIALLTFFSMLTTYLRRKNFKFELAADFIYCYKGIISSEEKRMPYTTIQDVTVNQGIMERIFGLASVNVKNAAVRTYYTRNGGQQVVNEGGITIPGQYIDNARKLADAIKNIALTKNPGKTGI